MDNIVAKLQVILFIENRCTSSQLQPNTNIHMHVCMHTQAVPLVTTKEVFKVGVSALTLPLWSFIARLY